MSYIIHGLLQDEIDYKKLIEAQANTPAFEARKVVGARRKYYNKQQQKSTKGVCPLKMMKR